MDQLDMGLYKQMGFTESVVKKALQYKKQHKIDIFDALQIIQKRDSPQKNRNTQKDIQNSTKTKSSILIPLKKINITDYQVVFSKRFSKMNSNLRKIDIRQSKSPVGLYNVSNCCYLNSLLQCYFLMPNFMKYIYQGQPLTNLHQLEKSESKIKIKRLKNQYNLLLTLKDIFSKMALSSKKHLDPSEVLKNLVDSVGEKIQYGEEKDLFQINISIIERLNQCLLYTKKYYKNKQKEESESIPKESELIDLQQSTEAKSFVNNSKIREIDNIKRIFYGKKVEYTQNVREKKQEQQILSDFLGIIINPSHGNFYKALDQEFHYDVQIQSSNQNKKSKLKRHTYIRQVPQYMFFYINRTSYSIEEKQALKNEQKLSFDFVIYLDRYLQKYRQEQMLKNPVITQLLNKKNNILKSKNHFELLAKKIQECYQYAQFVDGWINKLPTQKQCQSQKKAFDKQLEQIQVQLQKVQSRRQKYYLMYIFVHRGDAVSGHYWGYGRNNNQWYKFDVNCSQIKQQQVLVDLYKSGGTPYALVYAKQNQLPNFQYKYYHDFETINLANSSTNPSEEPLIKIIQKDKINQNLQVQSYFSFIPRELKQVIINQNIHLYQQYSKRKNIEIVKKTVQQYRLRFQTIKYQVNSFAQKQEKLFKMIPSYANFGMYLWFQGEKQLSKYNIYSTSLLITSNMKTKKLVQNQTLLNLMQREFRKKVKGQMSLKHFAIQCQPKEYQKYMKLFQSYYYQKQCLKLSIKIIKLIQDCQKSQLQTEAISVELSQILNFYISFKTKLKNNQSYIIHLLQEFIFIFLIRLSILKNNVSVSDIQINLVVPSLLKKQLCFFGNVKMIKNEQKNEKKLNISFDIQKANKIWTIQEISKFQNNLNFQKRFKKLLPSLKLQIQILKKVEKEKKLVKINQKGVLQQVKQDVKQQVNDILI